MVSKILNAYCFLFLIFTIGLNISSFSQNEYQPLNLNEPTSKKVENGKAKWERQRINSTIIDKRGQAYEGQLLYINDTIVYQYLSHEVYQSDLLISSTVKFNINDIEQIKIYRKGQTLRGLKQSLIFGSIGTLFLTFATEESAWGRMWNLLGATVWVMPVSTLAGVIIGSGRKIDVEYKTHNGNTSASDILPLLNKYALFPDLPPVDIIKKNGLKFKNDEGNQNIEIQVVSKTLDNPNSDNNRKNNFLSPTYISRFHVETGVSISANYRNNVLRNDLNYLGYVEGDIKDPFLNDLKLELGFSYQLNDHIRIALSFHPKSYWTEGKYDQLLFDNYYTSTNIYSYGSSTIIGAEYVFNPVTRIVNTRLEVAAGIGIARNPITVDHSLSIVERTIESLHFYETNNSLMKMNKWGIKAQFVADYYLTRNFSLYMKLASFYFTNMSFPKMMVTSEYLGMSGTLKPHETNISTIDLTVGLHVHF